MTEYYLVAGHRFSIEIEDGSPLWDRLDNYHPFRCEAGDCIFNLRYSKQEPVPTKMPFYKDKPEDEDQPRMEIYREADGPEVKAGANRWIIEMAPTQKMPICVRIIASPDFHSGVVHVANEEHLAIFGINNAAMLLYAFTTATLGTLEMHASVIANGGRGYLFLGKSGTGKSTHSNLWLKYVEGSELLNDDNPIVRVGQDGITRVYGSPWSGKTPCYRNMTVPAGAFVKLNQAPENRIRQCNILESYAAVYPSCSGLRQIREFADGMHQTIEHILLQVPCYELDCLPDEGAARLSSQTIR